MRYFLHLAYKGTAFRGWQRQPNAPSIQQTLEEALSKMLQTKIICMGCGRTDAEVNASQYIAHINYSGALNFDPVFRLNKMLPDDIVVFEMISVSPFAHAQYDVQWRTYDYFIHRQKHPLLSEQSSYYPMANINLEAMKTACKLIENNTDFKFLCRSPEKYDHTRCEVRFAKLQVNPTKDQICFRITANRFLRGMVRMLVSALVEIGTEQLSLTEFQSALSGESPLQYPKSAYPQGLHLSKVEYPYLSIEAKAHPLLSVFSLH